MGILIGHGYGWGLPGSTNSYSPSYTIRATENANTFSFIRQLWKLSEGDQPSLAKEELRRQVVIIGSGPAGLTAGIYTARANLDPLLIDAPADTEKQTTPGGQLMITTDVENYPGFSEGIQGPDLMVEFRKQAERFGTEFLEEGITHVDLQQRPFTLHTDHKTIKADTLIIASGASAKWLGIPGEAKTPLGF